ncbi:tyrosine-type recombinase/integrase [Falsirhodobacter halotolerans]|uniref:tyrosine-type recombinase/integrase n=1 Tax=Falsirhodobacter halotolerans TaxID=1146892 RepID=UPI001FD3A6EC|nr:tyrosine-type recombinase/integrase [Falsirhodobacter halotolerans]
MTLRHVQTIRKGSTVYRYLRIPGKPRIRLPDLPMDHPDFLTAYATAMRDAPTKVRAPIGSIAALIETFMRSERYLSLSQSYRMKLRKHCDAIRDQAEDAQLRHLRPEDIQADLAALTPVGARDRMKAWRKLCDYALEVQLIKVDPTVSVRRAKYVGGEGFLPWSADQIAAYRAHWPIGTTQRAAMELLYWTGSRVSDVVMLGKGMIDRQGVLTYRQQKTKTEAYVPWTCTLPAHAARGVGDRDMLHDALKASDNGHMTFLATREGRTRSHKSLGHMIAEAASDAGFDRSAHGLRKSRAVFLAEGGANPHQIGAWTGHLSLSEVQHYTKSASRKLAVIGTEQDQNSVNSPQPTVNRQSK